MSKSRYLKAAALAGLFIAILLLPSLVRPFQLEILIFLFINIIVVMAYRLIMITGEWSFIHVVLMGVGAYASALLVKTFGVSPWLGLPTGALVAALVAYLLSFGLFRMKGFYFMIGSFVVGEAIRLCWLKYRGIFGGSDGISGIPSLEFAGVDLSDPVPFYFFVLTVMTICLVAMYRLEKSRLGTTFASIASSDLLAGSIGVNARWYRVYMFTISAFFTGLAGALLAHYLMVISPHSFGLGPMLAIMIWAIVGGAGSFAGPIIGIVVLSLADEGLRDFGELRPGVYGLVLILTMIFLPKGLVGLPAQIAPVVNDLWRRNRRSIGSGGDQRPGV